MSGLGSGKDAGRKPARRTLAIGACIALAVGMFAAAVGPASASHPEVSLPGSDFEIDTNANLRVDDPAPSIDWASVADNRKADLPTGAGDDSFGQGAKEDTAVPTVVDGSIPPNKSDLLNFGGYLETTPSGARFLNIFWHRVQEPSGTTNMDFEFNKSQVISGNGVTPVRTAGDVLIQYDLAQGGTNPQLFLSRWVTTGAGSLCEANNSTPCWGTRVNLTAAGDAAGSINTSVIPVAESDGLATDIDGDGDVDPISPRTFGEAQVDFDALAGGDDECVSFGSAYLKSRSSDSFPAALKDFIAPLALDFDICGDIVIIKHDDATPPALLDGAEFDLLLDNAPVGGSPGAEDTFVDDCTTVMGTCGFTDVAQGEYWVVETVAPAGHDLPNPAFQHVTVVATETVTVTFVDPRQRGAILLTKTEKHAAEVDGVRPHAGVTFTIAGTTVVTDANGQACVDNLLFGSHNVIETVPAGYAADGATTKSVAVNNRASCTDSPYGGETVSFSNTPLTNVSVVVDSVIVGGTDTTVTCVPGGSFDTPDATGDGTHPLLNPQGSAGLLPGTYVCTVFIDP